MAAATDPRRAFLDELASRVTDRRVLAAVAAVDRSLFVAPDIRERAWHDAPLPIGRHQFISQPMLVATMCELLHLDGGERVLDVGAGSGYHAALLGRLARSVVSIERHTSLAELARHNLAAAGIDNVTVVVGDGSRGHPAQAPYEAINVAAAASADALDRLGRQLGDHGRLVAPTAGDDQRLVVLERRAAELVRTDHGGVRFVPLIADDNEEP